MTAAAKARAVLARREAEQNRARWAGDPVAFCAEALGLSLLPWQVAVARDVAAYSMVAWPTGHKLGKSTLIAALALWDWYTRDRALGILSSGNATQVSVILWREVRRLHREARVPLGGALHKVPASGLESADGRLLIGVTAADAERFQGYPGARFWIDEASGFDDALIEAALGTIAGGGGILLCGNPTRTSGKFASIIRERPEDWRFHQTSSLESPNVKAGKIVIKGLAEPEWVEMMKREYGEDSAAYCARVLGQLPVEGSDVVVPFGPLTTAVERWSASAEGYGNLEVGCDPARFGDDETVIAGVRGLCGLPAVVHRKLDNVEVAARVMEYLTAHRRIGEQATVRIDVGGLGAGVFDTLVRAVATMPGVTLVAVNSAESSAFPARFANKRAELWWSCRQWIKSGGTLPKDTRRDAELLAARYTHDSKLRIVVGSKDDMRKKLRRSPDRADAVCLATLGHGALDADEKQRRAYTAPIIQPKPAPRAWEGPPGMASGGPLGWLPGDRPDGYPRPSWPTWRPGDGAPRRRWE